MDLFNSCVIKSADNRNGIDMSTTSKTGSTTIVSTNILCEMPIILHHQNISTELGITNGSQGIVRQINTDKTLHGFTYGKSIIIEFPKS